VWVEEADSRERQKVRVHFPAESQGWKANSKSWQSGPPLTTRSTLTASMSAPDPSPVGRHWGVSQRWNEYQGRKARERWSNAREDTWIPRRRSPGFNLPRTTGKPPFSSATHKKSRPTNGTRLRQSRRILGGIDMLMTKTQSARPLFELITRFVAMTSAKGERERAAILSMSPATAKRTGYHAES